MSNEVTPAKREPEKALDYLGEVRNKLKSSFSRSGKTEEEHLDIEHNIIAIRAILAVNSEIFSRCMKYAEKNIIGDKTKLARFGFEKIKTRQEGKRLELVTQVEHLVQTFDTHPLSTPPSGFNKIVVVEYISQTKFIDFEDLFCKTLLLNDEALVFLLPKLKEHLETVQVCLGVLDEWAMQPIKNVSFIDSALKKEYKMLMEMDLCLTDISYKCWCCRSSTKKLLEHLDKLGEFEAELNECVMQPMKKDVSLIARIEKENKMLMEIDHCPTHSSSKCWFCGSLTDAFALLTVLNKNAGAALSSSSSSSSSHVDPLSHFDFWCAILIAPTLNGECRSLLLIDLYE